MADQDLLLPSVSAHGNKPRERYVPAMASPEKAAVRRLFDRANPMGNPDGYVITEALLHRIDKNDGKAGKGLYSKTFTPKDTRRFMMDYDSIPQKAPLSLCEFTTKILGGTCQDGHVQATRDEIYSHLMSNEQALKEFREYFGR